MSAVDAERAPVNYVDGTTGTRANVQSITSSTGSKTGNIVAPIFNSTTSWASIPINLSTKGRQATISFWVWWDSYTNNSDLLGEYTANWNTNNGSLLLDWDEPGVAGPCIGMRGGGSSFLQTLNANPAANQWHFHSITVDRNTSPPFKNWYMNGGTPSNSNILAPFVASDWANSTLYFMSRAGTSLFGGGRMATFLIHNRIISQAEHIALWQNTWQILRPKQRRWISCIPGTNLRRGQYYMAT